MVRRPPRSTRTYTLFPDAPLFLSRHRGPCENGRPARGRGWLERAAAWVPPGASEAEVGRQQHRARRAGRVTVAALVDRRHVVLVEQVVGVQAQVEVLAEGVAGDQVPHRVRLDELRRARRAVGA